MNALIHQCQRAFVAITLTLTITTTLAQTVTPPDVEAVRVQAIAEEAYIYGLPLVMTYGVMHAFSLDPTSSQYKGPMNQLNCSATLYTPADKEVPFANNDTLYCIGWLDLRAEPMVVTVPAVDEVRYRSVMLTDMSSVNYGLIGTRTTGNGAGDFLIVGPDWQGATPRGIAGVYRSTTQFTTAITRTELRDPTDIENVRNIQSGFRVRTLSNYTGSILPTPAADVQFPKINRELAKANFFAYLDLVLGFTPVRDEDKALRERMASIGLGSGNFEHFKVIAAKYGPQLMQGVQAGEQKINAMVAAAGPRANGWNWNYSLDTDRAHYTGDYLKRAAMSRAAPYGLNADEVMYPMTNMLPNGEPLDASKHNYTLTFKAGDFPPAEIFWSLTMYYGQSRSFVENTRQRYNINTGMLPEMKKNKDGSLTIYLQKDSPGKDKEANWLPAPDGTMYLVLRLYGIGEKLRANTWPIPPVTVAD
jgi:hypothetical protein